MASNFRIFVDHGLDRLHIRLDGDFDGTSAFELIYILGKCGRQTRKIVIDTSGLKRAFPFGRNTFCKNLRRITTGTVELIIKGRYSKRLSPRT